MVNPPAVDETKTEEKDRPFSTPSTSSRQSASVAGGPVGVIRKSDEVIPPL